EGRGGGAARAMPDRRAEAIEDRIAGASNAPSRHLETDEGSAEACFEGGHEGGLPEEVRLLHLHSPAEARLERGGRLVDFVAVQGQTGFEPERVARPETGGFEPERRTCLHERAPDRNCALVLTEDLDAVFARVAGARECDALAAQGSLSEAEGLERGFEVLERAVCSGQDLEGSWTLEREQGGLFTLVC